MAGPKIIIRGEEAAARAAKLSPEQKSKLRDDAAAARARDRQDLADERATQRAEIRDIDERKRAEEYIGRMRQDSIMRESQTRERNWRAEVDHIVEAARKQADAQRRANETMRREVDRDFQRAGQQAQDRARAQAKQSESDQQKITREAEKRQREEWSAKRKINDFEMRGVKAQEREEQRAQTIKIRDAEQLQRANAKLWAKENAGNIQAAMAYDKKRAEQANRAPTVIERLMGRKFGIGAPPEWDEGGGELQDAGGAGGGRGGSGGGFLGSPAGKGIIGVARFVQAIKEVAQDVWELVRTPQELQAFNRGILADSQPYLDRYNRTAALGRAGGFNSGELRSEFWASRGDNIPDWMTKTGFTGSDTLKMLEQYGLPTTLGQLSGPKGLIRGMTEDAVSPVMSLFSPEKTAEVYRRMNAIGLDPHRQIGALSTTTSMGESIDRSKVLSAMLENLEKLSQGSLGVNQESINDLFARMASTNLPGARTGADQSAALQGMQGALNSATSGQDPTKTTMMLRWMMSKGLTSEESVKSAIGEESFNKANSSEAGRKLISNVIESAKSNNYALALGSMNALTSMDLPHWAGEYESFIKATSGYTGVALDTVVANMTGLVGPGGSPLPLYEARFGKLPGGLGGGLPARQAFGAGVKLPGGSNRMMQILMQNGLSREAAAGMVGYATEESGLNPLAFNSAGGGHGAFGIGQWRGPRQAALMAFLKTKGISLPGPGQTMSAADQQKLLEAEAEFMAQELKGSEAGSLSAIESAGQSGGAVAAGAAAVRAYGRPSAWDSPAAQAKAATAARLANAKYGEDLSKVPSQPYQGESETAFEHRMQMERDRAGAVSDNAPIAGRERQMIDEGDFNAGIAAWKTTAGLIPMVNTGLERLTGGADAAGAALKKLADIVNGAANDIGHQNKTVPYVPGFGNPNGGQGPPARATTPFGYKALPRDNQ